MSRHSAKMTLVEMGELVLDYLVKGEESKLMDFLRSIPSYDRTELNRFMKLEKYLEQL